MESALRNAPVLLDNAPALPEAVLDNAPVLLDNAPVLPEALLDNVPVLLDNAPDMLVRWRGQLQQCSQDLHSLQ